MQLVKYVDEQGYLKQSLIKDDMLPTEAHLGIPLNPPDLSQLDCETMLKELNEMLINRELYTLSDVSGNNLLKNAVAIVVYKKVYQLYKKNHPTGYSNGNRPK